MPVLTEFPFGGGMNEAVAKRMLPGGVLEYTENFRPGQRGELVTRPGYTALSMSALQSGVAATFTALDITSYGEHLVAVGRQSGSSGPRELFVYHGSSNTWSWRGQLQGAGQLAICPVSELTEVWQAPLGVRTSQVDLAYANGYLCCVYRAPAVGDAYAHIFTEDGRPVLALKLSSVDGIRCVGVGNVLVIGVVDTSGNLTLRSFDTTQDEAFSAPVTADTGVEQGVEGAWDMAAITGQSTQFLVAYRVGNDVTWQRWTNALAQVGSNVTATDANARHITIQGHDGETINLCYRNQSTGNYVLRTYDEADDSLDVGPTTITASGTSFGQAAIARRDSTSIHLVIRDTDTQRNQVRFSHRLTGAGLGHAAANNYQIREVTVTGKPFLFDGDSLGGQYAGAPGLSFFGAFRSGVLVGLDPRSFVHGSTDHGLAIGDQNAYLSSTPTDGARKWFCVVLRADTSTIGTSASAGTPVVCSFLAGSEERRQFAEFGGLLYHAGGVLGCFDGRENFETGYLTPELTSVFPSASSGDLTPGTSTAATLTTLPVDPPTLTLNGETLMLSVDGGGFQGFVFDSGDVDPTNIASQINAGTTGITAAVSGDRVTIASDTTGSSSQLIVDGAPNALAALGFSAGQAASGVTTTVRYRYRACHIWRDLRGNLHRSAPSPIAQTDLGAEQTAIDLVIQSAHTSRRNDVTADSGSIVATELYRTNANGTVFRLVATREAAGAYAQALAYTDTMSDAVWATKPVLYTQAQTPEENVLAPACKFVAAGNERMLLMGLADPYAYQFGKLLQPEEPSNFPAPGRLAYRGRLHEPITGGVWDHSRWLLFTRRRPYQISGEGPGATGAGVFFTAKALEDAPGGAIDWKGILRTPRGVFFQLDDDKLYALRGDALFWAGERVRKTLASFPRIKASLYVRAKQMAVFAVQNQAGNDGRLLLCDLSGDGPGEWYIDNVGAVAALAEYDGRIAFVRSGVVYLEDEAPGTGAYVSSEARTGPFRMDTSLGYGACTGLGVLGENKGGTYTLFMEIRYDGADVWETIGQVDVSPGSHAVGASIVLLKAPPQQRTDTFFLRFRTGNGSADSAGIGLQSLVTETERAYSLSRRGSAETQ